MATAEATAETVTESELLEAVADSCKKGAESTLDVPARSRLGKLLESVTASDTRCRTLPVEGMCIQEREETGTPQLAGRGIVYNSWSKYMGFREIIRPGAVALPDDMRSLFNHDPSLILGRTTAGTLDVRATDKGVDFTVDLDDSISYVRDLIASVRRGDVSGCSFQFDVREWNWNEDYTECELIGIDVHEIGPVTFPAYDDTSVGMSARMLEAIAARGNAETITAALARYISQLDDGLKKSNNAERDEGHGRPEELRLQLDVLRRRSNL